VAGAGAETIDKGEHLLVQAGTGTGKSLGYLVPALRHAVLENEHVVVSTATLALQRQIITRARARACAPRPRRPCCGTSSAAPARSSPRHSSRTSRGRRRSRCSRAGTTTSA